LPLEKREGFFPPGLAFYPFDNYNNHRILEALREGNTYNSLFKEEIWTKPRLRN
jgi:hypothetical protein